MAIFGFLDTLTPNRKVTKSNMLGIDWTLTVEKGFSESTVT